LSLDSIYIYIVPIYTQWCNLRVCRACALIILPYSLPFEQNLTNLAYPVSTVRTQGEDVPTWSREGSDPPHCLFLFLLTLCSMYYNIIFCIFVILWSMDLLNLTICSILDTIITLFSFICSKVMFSWLKISVEMVDDVYDYT